MAWRLLNGRCNWRLCSPAVPVVTMSNMMTVRICTRGSQMRQQQRSMGSKQACDDAGCQLSMVLVAAGRLLHSGSAAALVELKDSTPRHATPAACIAQQCSALRLILVVGQMVLVHACYYCRLSCITFLQLEVVDACTAQYRSATSTVACHGSIMSGVHVASGCCRAAMRSHNNVSEKKLMTRIDLR